MVWHPEELYTPGNNYFFPMPSPPHPMTYKFSEGFVYEQRHVREALLSGKVGSLEHLRYRWFMTKFEGMLSLYTIHVPPVIMLTSTRGVDL